LRRSGLVLGVQQRAGALKIGRSIDTEGSRVNEGNINAHARRKGAQLLQFFQVFALARRLLHEACLGRPAFGLDAELV
jgi:hypothetical protein